MLVGAVAAWLPFSVRFVPFAGGGETNLPAWLQDVPVVSRLLTSLGWYTGEHTSVGEFLTVFGLPWAIAMVALIAAVLQFRPRGDDAPISRWLWWDSRRAGGRSCFAGPGADPGWFSLRLWRSGLSISPANVIESTWR